MNNKTLKNVPIDENSAIASRRKFLKQMAYGSLLAASGTGVVSAATRHIIYPGRLGHTLDSAERNISSRMFSRPASAHSFYSPTHKMLSFEHAHTGDKLNLTYFEQGSYIKGALQEINYLLRDYHTDDIHPIDTALLDQLFDLKQNLGIKKPFHIVSGYRSPFTNAQLRRHSRAVAEHSLHMQGRAIDIRIEGVSTRTIKNAAMAMARRGGIGYYPQKNFVHLDTGDVRSW